MQRRTRKWQHLGPEAKRLAALGLSPVEIADQLGVNRSTVHRWMDAGRLEETRESPGDDLPVPLTPAPDWAAAIRAAYPLDATDATLVDLAALALSVAHNAAEAPSVRLAAAGRFQSLVKQLATRIRASATDDERPAPAAQAVTARVDPRALLNPTIQ